MKAFLCRVALGTAAMTAAAACPVFTATIINSFPPPVRGGCSNNQAVLCLQDADCGAGNTCSNPAPGARGACSDDATKLCTADTDCVAGRCVNPPPVKPGKCKNNANLRCFGDSDCGGGVCSAPPPLSQGRCSQDRKKGCFEDIDCGGQNKCLPVLRTYAYPQPPDGTSGTIHHSITTAAIGRMALMGVPAYQSVLSNWPGQNAAPQDTVMQQCFAGGFALGNWSASHTFASAAGWYEPANNIPIDTPGACSDDNTVGCWLNRDCAAGATCTNPASVPSPQPGGCSNNPALRCARDADCAGLCSNFPGSVVQCLGDADCGVCANDNTRRCANANECLIAACNAPAAGTCVLGATCTRPLPGYGRCVANPVAGAGVRCLDNSQCPANQTCSGSGAGGCSQDATKLCLNDAACQPGGTCSNPSPKVLARTIDNFTRAWRQSAKDRTDAGMLGHFNAGLLGVAGSIAPDPYALASLPFQGEHPQYRSPDNAANGPNNTRTLQAVDQATGSKLYAILVAWGRPDPRHEVNVARVYETLVRKYNVPTQRVVLLYGNLPAGSKIGNFPARADGKPALYGGVATNAASDASITNPADAQGFFVDGPNSIENLYKAIKGDYYAANDKPAKNDRLFLYHTGHGGEVKKTLKGAKLLDTGVPAAVIADYAVWLSMPVPYYASYLLDQEEPDAMLGVDIRARQAFDLTRYPDLALTFVNGADAVFNAGRFADHPEWLEASAGADDPIPDDVPGEAAANYRLRVPPLALFDGTDDLQVPSIEFTGVDDSFFYSYHVVGVEISGGEWSEWATMPLDDQLTFTSPQTIAAGTANPGETFDLSHARLPGRLNGDFSSFASFGCRLFGGTADISSAGNPPTGWIDYWVLRIREDIDQTAGSWDEGWRQGYTRDRSMTQVCGGFP